MEMSPTFWIVFRFSITSVHRNFRFGGIFSKNPCSVRCGVPLGSGIVYDRSTVGIVLLTFNLFTSNLVAFLGFFKKQFSSNSHFRLFLEHSGRRASLD